MAEEKNTRVTKTSWFGRLGSAFKAVLLGLALAVIGLGLLWWNEGARVAEYKSIQEGAGAVVSIDADQPDPAHDGRLVHLVAEATTDQTVADPQFGVEAVALRLERRVEMYQWRELQETRTEKKVGGGTETVTTYRYEPHWAPQRVASETFQDRDRQNPAALPVPNQMWFPERVTLGAFVLSQQQVMRIGSSVRLDLTAAELAGMSPALASQMMLTPDGLYLPVGGLGATAPGVPTPAATSDADDAEPDEAEPDAAEPADAPQPEAADADVEAEPDEGTPAAAESAQAEPTEPPTTEPPAAEPEPATASSSDSPDTAETPGASPRLPEGLAPAEPRIGDARIRFHVVKPQTISVVAQQAPGPVLRPYATQGGMAIDRITAGSHSAEAMFEQMEADSLTKVWLIRAGGLIAVFIGLRMFFGPLQVIADILPFMGRMVGAGLSVICFALAASASLVTIAVAWLAYRPTIGVPLLLVAGAFAGFALWRTLTARRRGRRARA